MVRRISKPPSASPGPSEPAGQSFIEEAIRKAKLQLERRISLREALGEATPEARRAAVGQHVYGKLRDFGWDSLTEVERMLSRVFEARNDFATGDGISRIVFGLPEGRDAIIDAIERVGARRTAAVLREAAVVLDAALAERGTPAETHGDLIDCMGVEYDRLDRALFALRPDDEIEAALARWIDAHREELGDN